MNEKVYKLEASAKAVAAKKWSASYRRNSGNFAESFVVVKVEGGFVVRKDEAASRLNFKNRG